MIDDEYEFTLEDVKSIVQSKNKTYDLENFGYISFSGGGDSMLTHLIIDESLPNNNIPRVYMNTGIEHQAMRKYVQELAKKDKRFVILTPKVNIPKMLKKDGYPFKSKQHSQNYGVYFRNKEQIKEILDKIEKKPELKFDYDFIHNLSKGTKSIIKYVVGVREKDTPIAVDERERERVISTSIQTVPKVLEYQFKGQCKLFISDKCCLRLKEQPLDKWAVENKKNIAILGLRASEGGRRSINKKCMAFSKKRITFKPLMFITDEFKEEYFKRNNIKLCDLYYPPFNFKRTGCIGCPFNENIQEDLNIMYKLLPNEYKQCIHLWKPVYDEYIRLGYRLKYYPHEKGLQMTLEDYMEE